MTFSELGQSSSEETRYLLDERSAIHEFEGGLNRVEAEIRTMQEWKGDRYNRLRREAGLD